MKEFVGLKAKTNRYLNDNNDEDKKAKDTKIYFIKIKNKFQDYKEAAQIEKNKRFRKKNWCRYS